MEMYSRVQKCTVEVGGTKQWLSDSNEKKTWLGRVYIYTSKTFLGKVSIGSADYVRLEWAQELFARIS